MVLPDRCLDAIGRHQRMDQAEKKPAENDPVQLSFPCRARCVQMTTITALAGRDRMQARLSRHRYTRMNADVANDSLSNESFITIAFALMDGYPADTWYTNHRFGLKLRH